MCVVTGGGGPSGSTVAARQARTTETPPRRTPWGSCSGSQARPTAASRPRSLPGAGDLACSSRARCSDRPSSPCSSISRLLRTGTEPLRDSDGATLRRTRDASHGPYAVSFVPSSDVAPLPPLGPDPPDRSGDAADLGIRHADPQREGEDPFGSPPRHRKGSRLRSVLPIGPHRVDGRRVVATGLDALSLAAPRPRRPHRVPKASASIRIE